MAGVAVERVLQKLTGVKSIANGWVAHCPSHEDHHQSLQISERDDLSVGLHCHAGCSKNALLDSLSLTFSDLYEPKPEGGEKPIIASFDYRSLTGELLYQAIRFYPKEFRQRRPDGAGGWTWNMATLKGKHVPYRLPELKGQNVVVIVEGEKDADRLWKLGIPATTNIGGAGKWGSSETKGLVAAGVSRVLIVPDNDEPGQKHAQVVAVSVKQANIAVSVIELPHLELHGDVSDWLNNGGTKEALQDLFAAKPYVVSSGVPTPLTAPLEPQDGSDAPNTLDITEYHLTDLGAAESLRDRFGDLLRYDHQRETWLVWDGHFWRPDLDDNAMRIANDHVRKLQADSLKVPDYLERKKYLDWALGREKRAQAVAMMSHASALKPIAISGEQWDANGWLLGCQNGVIDLRTGNLREGDRSDFVTLQTGPTFDPASECGRWVQFLDEVFDGDVELIDYIWRAVGYSLTADIREQCFFVMFGSGSNGKSIFIDALETVFGTYGHRSDMRMFAGFSQDANAFQNADFRGKHLIFAAEVRPNSRMNEHVLKHLTGGETLRAEHKYGRSFTIRPVGKIWLGVNHRPKVADDSFGFWRRVRLIPFLRTFSGSNEDRSLRDTLRAEAPGILAWAVRGCLAWQTHGLAAPAVVQRATDEYQQGEDPLAEFFETRIRCDETTTMSVVPFVKLYAAYRDWASSQGMSDREKMSAKAFGNAMQTRPFDRAKINGSFCFKGFELVTASLLP